MRQPIDIEAALQTALNNKAVASGVTVKAFAPPLPPTLSLPCVLIERMGGSEQDVVIDRHTVEIDTRADSWEHAQQYANAIIGHVRDLEGKLLGGVPCYSVELNTQPYNNFDPEHQDVPRVTFSVLLSTRTSTT